MPSQNRKELEVWQACDNLTLKNVDLSYENLGNELINLGYKKGSNSDLQKYRQSWQLNHESLQPIRTALPERPDKLTSVIDEIRAEAKREANSELEGYKSQMEATLKQLNDNISYSQNEIAELRNQNKKITTEIERLENDKQLLANEKNTLTIQLNTEMTTHQHTQVLYAELQKTANTEIQLLHQRLQEAGQLQESIQQLHKKTLDQLIEKMESQRHQHIAEMESIKGEKLRLEKELVKSATAEQSLQKFNQVLTEQIKVLESRLNEQHVQLHQRLQQLFSRLSSHEEKVLPAIAVVKDNLSTNLIEQTTHYQMFVAQQCVLLNEIENLKKNLPSAPKS